MANVSTPEARLLVVDDEPNIVELLEASLRFHGFDVTTCGDGTTALTLAKSLQPDLMVADVMMPGLNGFELVRSLRADGFQFPVLFLTAKDAVEDRVTGLTIGGDDYIVKPFSLNEVVARIRVVLKRSGKHAPLAARTLLAYDDLELDEAAHEVRRGGRDIALSPTEFRLLRYLVENAETVVSKAQILDNVWQYDFGGEMNVVESYISYLRRKVDTVEPRLIHTIRGVGYVLRKPRS
ncbi:MAG: response regulator transcription factor [Actinomycetota bacterium]|nr:response regulator transcription factor [Actinomycetota bacterium]